MPSSRAVTWTAWRPTFSGPAVVFALLAIFTVVKLAWALNSAGSVDAVLFFNFARGIDALGLTALYPLDQRFNHTPLTGMVVLGLYRFAQHDFLTFSFFLRSLGIAADAAVVLALVRWRGRLGELPWWALALFAASPVSLMVSGFHGNVDPVLVAALFFAAAAAAFERPWLAGALFGLACNVKVVPIVFAPVFFFYFWPRRGAWRFAASSAAMIAAGSALPLLVCPAAYLKNVFGYGSSWGVWGLPYLLRLTGWAEVQKIDFHDLTLIQSRLATLLKAAAILSILLIAWRRRAVRAGNFPATLGAAWAAFFVFAPGIGVQYMVWFAPFVLLASARTFAALTAAASVFLAVFYHSTSAGRFPWMLAIPRGPETPLWSAWGTPCWLAFVAAAVVLWPHTAARPSAQTELSTPREAAGAADQADLATEARAVEETGGIIAPVLAAPEPA